MWIFRLKMLLMNDMYVVVRGGKRRFQFTHDLG